MRPLVRGLAWWARGRAGVPCRCRASTSSLVAVPRLSVPLFTQQAQGTAPRKSDTAGFGQVPSGIAAGRRRRPEVPRSYAAPSTIDKSETRP
jgi:hypothetical protein